MITIGTDLDAWYASGSLHPATDVFGTPERAVEGPWGCPIECSPNSTKTHS